MMFQIDQDFRDTFISYLGPCLAGAERFELAWNTFHQSQQTQPTRHHGTYHDSLALFKGLFKQACWELLNCAQDETMQAIRLSQRLWAKTSHVGIDLLYA